MPFNSRLTESLLTLVYSLAIGMSMAATAMVARRVGEKNPEEAAIAAMQSIIAGIFCNYRMYKCSGYCFAQDILRLMGAEHETLAIGTTYIQILMSAEAW